MVGQQLHARHSRRFALRHSGDRRGDAGRDAACAAGGAAVQEGGARSGGRVRHGRDRYGSDHFASGVRRGSVRVSMDWSAR